MMGCVCMKRVVCVYVHARGREGGDNKNLLAVLFFIFIWQQVFVGFFGFFLRGWGKNLELYLPWPREALRGHW